jgi:predicted amidohydrolase
MTRYEREVWDVRPGGPLRLFDTALGRIGVLICYDSEFPLLGRALMEAGAEILLVHRPAPRRSRATGASASAPWPARSKGSAFTVHSPLSAPRRGDPVDEQTGAGGVYGPPDLGFPETGVLAEGRLNAPAGSCHGRSDAGRAGAPRGVPGVEFRRLAAEQPVQSR